MKCRINLFIIIFISFYSNNIFSQKSIWKTDNFGWVLRKKTSESSFSRYFAVGLWGLPDYKQDNSRFERSQFYNYTKSFDMIYLRGSDTKNYMTNKIIISGSSEFPWYINRYIKNLNSKLPANQKNNLDMNFLENHSQSVLLKKEINKAIDLVVNLHSKNGINDYIWAPIDEVSSWPPSIPELLYIQIKLKDKNTLVYVDLLGNGKKKSFKNKTEADINPDYSSSKFEENWYHNVKEIAGEYSNGGDVFGLNSYTDFFYKPKLAGISVDAIKAGIGKNTPVWLWFDASYYAKPRNISNGEYLKNVKCQIYTSIIHGATGVMFWTYSNKNIETFNSFIPIVEDIYSNIPVIKSKTIQQNAYGDLHYLIKEFKGKEYVIISNTNKDRPISITKPITKTLAPLEVYIGKIN